MTRAGRFGRVFCGSLAGLVALCLLLGLPVVARQLFVPLQIYPALTDDQIVRLSVNTAPDTAIVILTAGRRRVAPEYGGGTLDGLSLERARYGARLARRTGLPVLAAGGIEIDGHTLAELLARALLDDWGVPTRWQEDQSATTAENAVDAAVLLRRDGIRRIVLVTHAWHMRRAVLAFRAQGFEIIPAPTGFEKPVAETVIGDVTPDLNTFRRSVYALHELVGIAWYEVRYGYRSD